MYNLFTAFIYRLLCKRLGRHIRLLTEYDSSFLSAHMHVMQSLTTYRGWKYKNIPFNRRRINFPCQSKTTAVGLLLILITKSNNRGYDEIIYQICLQSRNTWRETRGYWKSSKQNSPSTTENYELNNLRIGIESI